MSKVIKNNDGVAVVEGTPAASLVKDVNKFFAAKPPERMAGESVFQPRKLDPRAINTRRPTPKDLEQMNNPPRNLDPKAINLRGITKKAPLEKTETDTLEDNRRINRVETDVRNQRARENNMSAPERMVTPVKGRPNVQSNRNEARDKAESRRKRFFERRRSRKEAERSQTEQEATQGKFITTLGR